MKKLHPILSSLILLMAIPLGAQVTTNTGTLYGKVLDENQTPLPGVVVQLESDVIPSLVATTGPTGSFRFANLPPGNFSATFQLPGFTELKQEGIRITVGIHVELEIIMKISPVEELTIVGETPLLDKQKTGHETTYSRESLDQIPGGRDPWFVIEQTPGIDSDRFNVAGSESGQQSTFIARGGFGQPAWNLDGINVTDFGGASFYPNFDSLEEIEILAGGNDASIQTGSVSINLVTKRGGNAWNGNASYYFVDDALQSDNTPQELIDNPIISPITGEPAKGSNRINKIQEYGFDIGGPVIKDKLFLWGAIRKNQIELFMVDDVPDHTRLLNYNVKGNLSWNQEHESEIAYVWSDKAKDARLFFPGVQSPETFWNQEGNNGSVGLEGIISAQHTWIPNDHMLLTSRYGYMGMSWGLIPGGGKDIPMIYLSAVPLWEDTLYYVSPIEHPGHDLNTDTNYFKEDWLGGDHEFKFGFSYSHDRFHAFSSYGNGLLLIDFDQTQAGGPLTSGLAIAQHPVNYEYSQNSYGMYVSDTYRKDRLTLNLGMRFDHQTAKNDSSTIPGVPGFEEFVGGFEYPGGDPGIAFNDISPRFGLTYDLKGNGKTILRGNFARYYDAFDPYVTIFSNPTAIYNGAYFEYQNQNGDRIISPEERSSDPLGFYGGLVEGGFDLNAFLAKHRYAEDISNSWTNEFIAGVEKEVVKDVSLSATYTYRKYGNFLRPVPFGVSPDDYVLADEPYRADTPLGSFEVPYYVLGFEHDGTGIFTNVDGYSRTYHGLDMVVRKRMSQNFLLNGSLTLQTQKAHYDGDSALGFVPFIGFPGSSFAFDPGLLNFVDDQAYLPAGRFAVNPFSEWYLKMSGYYQLPRDFGIGAFFRYQQGYPYVLVGEVRDPSLHSFYGTQRHLILVEPYGSRRHENKLTLDLRMEKRFVIEKYGALTAIVDIFNITNENAVLIRRNRIDEQFNRIREVFSPRAIRFGVRFSY